MKSQNFLNNLFKPVSSAGLAVFRALFGFVMLWEVYLYFDHGWIERYWAEPVFNFKYEFFAWAEPHKLDRRRAPDCAAHEVAK